MDVRVGEQAQSLQPFLVGYGLRKSGNRGGIEDVAALHGSGHVQMVFNERLNFPSFLGRKFQALGRAIERREAPGDVILDRHAFADIVQQQRENQQVAPLRGLPELREMRSALVGRVGEFLQVLDGAQGVLVHGVAVIKIAHHQRIDRAHFRQNFHQDSQPVHRPQSHPRIIGGKNFLQRVPAHQLIAGGQLGVRNHVVDNAFGIAAKHGAATGRFREQRINDCAIGQRRLVHNFELPTANREVRSGQQRFGTGHAARCAE